MAHKLEEQINALVDAYLADYAQGKDIDKVDSLTIRVRRRSLIY